MKTGATFGLLFLVLTWSGCGEQTAEPTPKSDDPIIPGIERDTTFFPTSIGCTWTYVDSVFSGEEPNVYLRTMKLQSIRRDSMGRTLTLFVVNRCGTGTFDMRLRNDSLYELYTPWRGTGIDESLLFFPPPDTGAYYESTIQDGCIGIRRHARRGNQEIRTPLGVFHAHYVYESPIEFYHYVHGIGIIREEHYDIWPWRPLLRSSTLIDFKLSPWFWTHHGGTVR